MLQKLQERAIEVKKKNQTTQNKSLTSSNINHSWTSVASATQKEDACILQKGNTQIKNINVSLYTNLDFRQVHSWGQGKIRGNNGSPPARGLSSAWSMMSAQRNTFCSASNTQRLHLWDFWSQENNANMAFLRFLIKRSSSSPTPYSSTIYII